MADRIQDKQTGPSKSFMTVGPTLHYSHANVRRCWGLAILVFAGTCLFWSKILTGVAFYLDPHLLIEPGRWGLSHFIGKPISIYEYPWQIAVLGLLMGIISSSGVIISQLMSFRYSIPFILTIIFIARLPLLGIIVLISCIAVACRPLRFRSRFIAIALCMTPQLAYWGIFGGTGKDPLLWGISYSSWIGAWLTGLGIAGIVIGVGHFTRYRPGLTWVVTGIFLCAAFFIFQSQISFSELDYQIYIAGNAPEELPEFRPHHLSDVLDKSINDPETRKEITSFFFPTEPEPLKKELINDIALYVVYNKWPFWFNAPAELQYQKKRERLLHQYDLFINKHPSSVRMPIALYYKGMLEEFIPDVNLLKQKGILSFSNNYPQSRALPTWLGLFSDFPESDESLEARWRIAMHRAANMQFTIAAEHCSFAKLRLGERIKELKKRPKNGEVALPIFSKPPDSVMSPRKLDELLQRLNKLEILIANAEKMQSEEAKSRLGQFIRLNPCQNEYAKRLDDLLEKTPQNDPLIDNLILSRAMLQAKGPVRATKLHELNNEYPGTDGGIEALYKLGILNKRLWKSPEIKEENKPAYLLDARNVLTSFIKKYPDSYLVPEAQKNLDELPKPNNRP
ncbi:MAG: hypothetical protein FVQ82_05240 [Planctomycetes bacterium]|nr:hypothetical protein [Planctomycetota bacterium]